MSVITIGGDALARVTFNALAFIPKLAKVPLIRVRLSASGIEVGGSDGYAVGVDSAPVHNGPGQPVTFTVNREDLAELEGFARAWKKEALSLRLIGETMHVSASGESVSLSTGPLEHPDAWTAIDTYYARTVGGSGMAVAFDPALLARFSKVKADKDRVGDFLFADPETPAIVKVGGTFRGLVMPLYREPAKDYAEPDGLW